MARNAATHVRANPKFARLVKRLTVEASRQQGRQVTASEVTAIIASVLPPTWAEFRSFVSSHFNEGSATNG